MHQDTLLHDCLSNSRTIAVVGLSDKPHRASHQVGKYLLDHGYTVIPVNPTVSEVLGQTAYASLADVPVSIDMVDCFRRSEEMASLAEQAVEVGARVLWMQLGVISEEAAAIARKAGLQVVMDRCTKIEHARLLQVADGQG